MKQKVLLFAAVMLSGLTACGGGESGSAPVNYTVQVGTFVGGKVLPGTVTVSQGQTATFTVTADVGYELVGVTGCAGALTASSYQTGPISANCSINATFNKKSYLVSASANSGGSISPAQVNVLHDETASFNITVNSGFEIDKVTGCNGALEGSAYITGPITDACNVEVSFAATSFVISASSAGGGVITPSTLNVSKGETAEFILKPDSGFRLKQVDGCLGRFTGNKYIVENISADCAIVAQFNSADIVEFADAQLARVVKRTLGIPLNEAISASRINQLTSLLASGQGITRLDGLQYATALNYLDLSQNNISNFSPLSLLATADGAAKVTSLYIGNNPISLLPDFSRLSQLQNLSLQSTGVDVLPSLSSLINLKYLNLQYNKINDISTLNGLQITDLYLSGNPLQDNAFSVLRGMPLTTLFVDNTKFLSAENINTLNELTYLSANYTLLSNLKPLVGLQKLRNLSIYGSQVIDIAPLLDMFPNNNAAIFLGGCLKTQGFARAPQFIEQLKNRGNFVWEYSWAIPYDTGCTSGENLIENFSLNATIDKQALSLNWALNSDDVGPWRCELHLDLGAQQQPRAPVQVLDNCHTMRNWTIPNIIQDAAEPHLIIDTGLVRTLFRANAGRVLPAAGLPDPYLHSIDWLQVVVKSNPYLIPYRAAKLRLHMVSPSNATPPLVDAWIQQGANRTPLVVKAPLRLPAQKRQENLSENYLIDIPAALAQPGIEVVVSVAGRAEHVIKPQFATINSIDLTLVPFQLGENVTILPENSLIEKSILTVWPFANVNITRRAPFALSAAANVNSTSSMLRELFDLRIAEGGTSYYYGYFSSDMNTDRWGGMAYRPGFSGVGQLPTSDIDFILSHELGHNLNIQHAPCGDPSGVDPNYPYSNASIGTFGVPLSFNTLLSPSIYKDLMSYCGTRHISDYNLELAQDYITVQQNSAALHLRPAAAAGFSNSSDSTASAAEQGAMFYRLQLNADTKPTVVQAMQITHVPNFSGNSRFRVLVEYTTGVPQLFPVEKLVFGHGDSTEQISFAVPLRQNGANLIAWTLFDGSRILHQEQREVLTAQAKSATTQPQVSISEKSGEVCVNHQGRFDAMNLLLQHPQGISVIALNERAAQFCRPIADLPSNGRWQLQSRRNYTVDLHNFAR